MKLTAILLFVITSSQLIWETSAFPHPHSSSDIIKTIKNDKKCRAWLVQSIPTDMPHLSHVPGVLSTADVLRWLAGNSSKSLDIIAQYWSLIAHPHDPRSGDYGYSDDDMKKFGADEGFQVYKAIEKAADRNISIRRGWWGGEELIFDTTPEAAYIFPSVRRVNFLLLKFESNIEGVDVRKIIVHSGVYPDYTEEPSKLASGRPNVESVTLLFKDWWGSGVVHAKVWISDHQDVYIGSANNDWKSLTQVKELGIYVVGCPKVVKHVETYYDNLWKLGHLNASSHTKPVRDEQWQIDRPVPCWSHFLHSSERCRSPLPEYVEIPHVAGYPVLSDPFSFKIPIETPGGNISTLQPHLSYLSFAPPELLFGKFQSDEHAWVETIKSVTFRGTVRINTMDWLGQSGYAKQTVFWSTLSSAVSEFATFALSLLLWKNFSFSMVVFSKQANVRILVAYWAHFIDNTDEYLKSLLYSNVLCSSSKYNNCSGKVEVKYYIVPEFNLTGPAIDKNGSATGNTYSCFLTPEPTMAICLAYQIQLIEPVT
ncbi:hypothetical protein Leryth_010714 [Lithospermum erythrorhizon]|nr:hypothetical protein Leryth_010714 [Lithospermum erythrorhizon]